jgi:hypothetical protein
MEEQQKKRISLICCKTCGSEYTENLPACPGCQVKTIKDEQAAVEDAKTRAALAEKEIAEVFAKEATSEKLRMKAETIGEYSKRIEANPELSFSLLELFNRSPPDKQLLPATYMPIVEEYLKVGIRIGTINIIEYLKAKTEANPEPEPAPEGQESPKATRQADIIAGAIEQVVSAIPRNKEDVVASGQAGYLKGFGIQMKKQELLDAAYAKTGKSKGDADALGKRAAEKSE